MERYENIVKMEEIRRVLENGQYVRALKILDTIDINKMKTLTDLSIIADVYTGNGHYDDAMRVLMKIYTKTKTRRIIYQLVDLSIKRGSITDAENYLKQYIKAAPQDFYRFIFRYYIDKLKGEAYEVLISSLEQLKEYEYIEMWAYELAKLYHKAGMKDKCVRECSDIVLWFGDGIYVEKAKLLKAYYVGEINPVHMLKAEEKREAEKRLGLDKTKDYSSMRSQIDQFIQEDEQNEKLKNTNLLSTAEESTDDRNKKADDWNKTTENQNKTEKELEQEKEYFDEIASALEANILAAQMEEQSSSKESVLNEKTPADGINTEVEPDFITDSETKKQDIAINLELKMQENTDNMQGYAKQTVITEDIKDIPIEELPIEEIQEAIPADEIQKDDVQTEVIQAIEVQTKEVQEEILTEEEQTEEQTEEVQTEEIQTKAIQEEIQDEDTITDDHQEADKLQQLFQDTGIDYQKILGYFIRIGTCREQIESCLESVIKDHNKVNHMVICGGKKSGKTTLGKKFAALFFHLNCIRTAGVAMIHADKLNRINLEQKKDKLTDQTLIIEEAGLLEEETVDQLLHLMWYLDEQLIVILEDTDTNIQQLLQKFPKLSSEFKHKILLPSLTTQDLNGFANSYIEENGYYLSKDAKAILTKNINSIVNNSAEEEWLDNVFQKVRMVKKEADERNRQELSRVINTRKFDPTDFLIIKEEDFK